MANRRMASAELFEDDFIGSLDFFQRLVWIGLFVSCADDQGRVIDNNSVIRSKVFLFDTNVDDRMIENAVKILADAGKIVRYVSSNKRLIQIVKWWQYQTPSWASPSRFPAPDGWVDRAKFHTIGNKIEQMNWDMKGGFDNQILHSGQGSAIKERKEEKYERREVDGCVPVISPIQESLEKITGLPPTSADDVKAMDEIAEMNPLQDDIESAFNWIQGQGRNIHHYRSMVNPIRVSIAKRVQKPLTTLDKSKAAVMAVLQEYDEVEK